MSDFSILRRIAERGLSVAQADENSEQIDCWQHMIDELSRAQKLYDPASADDLVELEINLDDDILLDLSLQAHRKHVTLNHHLTDLLTQGLEKLADEHLTPEVDENGTSDD